MSTIISLQITKATIKYKDDGLRLIASTEPAGTVTWHSDNPKIAKVSSDGFVTAVDMGTTTIYATAEDGSYATCEVTVTMTLWQRIVRWFKILFGVWNTSMSVMF